MSISELEEGAMARLSFRGKENIQQVDQFFLVFLESDFKLIIILFASLVQDQVESRIYN